MWFERVFRRKNDEQMLTISELFPNDEKFIYEVNDKVEYWARDVANKYDIPTSEVHRRALAIGRFVIDIIEKGGNVSYELNGKGGNILGTDSKRGANND